MHDFSREGCTHLKQRWLLLFLGGALVVGCSAGSGSGSSGGGATQFSGGLTGMVADGPVAGATVQLFLVTPGGVLGAPTEAARTFPLTQPQPFQTAVTDSAGLFTMDSVPAGTYLLTSTGGRYVDPVTGETVALEAAEPLQAVAVLDGSGDRVAITPFTSCAATRAFGLMVGQAFAPAQAMTQANAEVAAHFGLGDIVGTFPAFPGEAGDPAALEYGLMLNGLSQYAADQGFKPVGLTAALARDARDAVFDGLEAGKPIPVLTREGGARDLPANAGTSGLATAVQQQFQGRGVDEQDLENLIASTGRIGPDAPGYVSPYSLKFQNSLDKLTVGFDQAPRNAVRDQGCFPEYEDWGRLEVYPEGERPWGPFQTTYPLPDVPAGIVNGDRALWRRERLLATAQKWIGTIYQHHHIPDWTPPAGWPAWSPVAFGRNSAGIDCSDFSSWVYDYALGLRLCTDVAQQATMEQPTDCERANQPEVCWHSREIQVQRVLQATSREPVDFETIKNTLKTGDLLYIRGEPTSAPDTNITHVIMWVGEVGQNSEYPLVIDSHGASVTDSNGVIIPVGVHLRPFRPGSWYHAAFDHAHRLVHDEPAN